MNLETFFIYEKKIEKRKIRKKNYQKIKLKKVDLSEDLKIKIFTYF